MTQTDPPAQFTIPAVVQAISAAIPDRELIIQGDHRYSYAEIVERSHRLASYLHSRGLGCHTERSALPGHEAGTGSARALRLQRERIRRGTAGCFPSAGCPVQRQLPLRQERAGVPAGRCRRVRTDLPCSVRSASGRDPCPTFRSCGADPDRRRIGQRTARMAQWITNRSSPPARRRCRRCSIRPTTCTCSIPAARRECPKACFGVSTTSS